MHQMCMRKVLECSTEVIGIVNSTRNCDRLFEHINAFDKPTQRDQLAASTRFGTSERDEVTDFACELTRAFRAANPS